MSASVGSGKSWPTPRGRWQRLSRIWTRPANGWQPSRRATARERLREVGMLAQRRAVEVAQKRRQFEQLDDAPSEEVCALAGRLFLHTAAGGDHLEAWRQFSGQITPDDPELRQLLQAWRQLEHERRKKVLEFSQDQLALSLLRVEKAILGSVQTPEEAFEIVRNLSAWTAENGQPSSHSPIGEEAVREVEEREVMPMEGARHRLVRSEGMKDPRVRASLSKAVPRLGGTRCRRSAEADAPSLARNRRQLDRAEGPGKE